MMLSEQWPQPRPLWKRALGSIGNVGVWRDLANEWRLKSPQPYTTREPISFPLDSDKLRNVSVRWPVRSQWPGTLPFGNDIRLGLKRFVVLTETDVLQPCPGVIIFQLEIKGRSFDVAADFRDYPEVIQDEALKRSLLYFKWQFRRGGYPELGEGSGKVLPGGYIASGSKAYLYVEALRSDANRARIFDVYGRFGLRYSREIREKAINALRAQTQFRYEGGAKRVRYSRTLTEISQSQVCIDLPGNGPFCSRLVDYFAVGACVVGPPHGATFHVPLESGKHLAYCKEDLSDLVPLCQYYLQNQEARESLIRNSRLYFDRYLHREQLAAYYLHEILKLTA